MSLLIFWFPQVTQDVEIGRLTAIVAERQGQITYGQQENERLRNERDVARNDVIKLSRDLGSLRAKEQFFQDEKNKLEQKVAELEETVRRQARTIKVQSEQIAAPKEANRTPNRGAPAFGLENRQQGYQQPAPVFNPQTVQATTLQHGQQSAPVYNAQSVQALAPRHGQQPAPGYKPQLIQTTAPHYTQQPTSVYKAQPVQPLTSHHSQRMQPGQQLQATSQVQTASLQISVANQNTSVAQGPSNALVVQGDEMPRINWIEEFSEFFDLTLTFCRNFGNVPNHTRDNALPDPLLSELQRLSPPASVRGLLGSGDTRYYLVASLLNHAVCGDIFRSSLVKGYTPESDQKLSQIRGSIKPGIKVSMKRGLVKAAADILVEMRKIPHFQQWIERQVGTKASITWDHVADLLAPEVDREDAFDSLSHVFTEAYRIGLMMYSVPFNWTIDFPAIADNSYFDPTTMINYDVQFPGDPVSLRQQHLRVRLGMTPTIFALNYMDEAIMPRTVHFAQVLLRR